MAEEKELQCPDCPRKFPADADPSEMIEHLLRVHPAETLKRLRASEE